MMVADNDFNIVYLNRAVIDMMRRAEADLRKDLPQFDAARLVGANIDVFHKEPSHQRSMVTRMTGPYRTRIKVGGRSFDLMANPVTNEAGLRLGTVVEWRDVTAELGVLQEITTIVQSAAAGDFSRRLELAGQDGPMKALAEGLNVITAQVDGATADLARPSARWPRATSTAASRPQYQGRFAELKDALNETIAVALGQTVGTIQTTAERCRRGGPRDQHGRRRPVAAHRGAGLLPGGDRRDHRGARRLGEGLAAGVAPGRSTSPTSAATMARPAAAVVGEAVDGHGAHRAGLASKICRHHRR